MNYQPVRHLLCQHIKGGIRILRVYGDHPNPGLPDSIMGLGLIEVGPYCFSAAEKMPPEDSFIWIREENGDWIKHDRSDDECLPPALCGPLVVSVRLPSAISTLHNGAFYNCRQLRNLSFGPAVRAIGSDVFTNCRKLDQLEIRADDRSPTGLSLLLERLPDDLTVRFTSGSLLFFPEYYEWLDEVTPAHLFSRSINGEGYRMRKCFRDKILDYGKYDQCFPSALRTESDRTLCRIALARLRHPSGLNEDARDAYLAAIRKRSAACLDIAVDRRSTDLIHYICREAQPSPDMLSEAYSQAEKDGWSEGAAILTEEIHRRYQKPSYDFDLDF